MMMLTFYAMLMFFITPRGYSARLKPADSIIKGRVATSLRPVTEGQPLSFSEPPTE